ncbi:MAG: hypothetical protein L0Z71_08570, partial [Anaerolineae bacterium]|nr:hypothetical protein [Anaerolineae bacterium]
MGIFYTNITLFKVEHNQVLEFLQKEKRTAYVSPQQGNFVVVFDKETEDQDQRILMDLASKLSKTFRCNTFASLVHDGDVFYYWLYEKGKLVDKYNSAPDYFESDIDEPMAPTGGNAKRLCTAFDKQEAISEIIRVFETAKETALNLESDSYADLFGEQIHFELAKS